MKRISIDEVVAERLKKRGQNSQRPTSKEDIYAEEADSLEKCLEKDGWVYVNNQSSISGLHITFKKEGWILKTVLVPDTVFE